jgi:hypothetical protein
MMASVAIVLLNCDGVRFPNDVSSLGSTAANASLLSHALRNEIVEELMLI